MILEHSAALVYFPISLLLLLCPSLAFVFKALCMLYCKCHYSTTSCPTTVLSPQTVSPLHALHLYYQTMSNPVSLSPSLTGFQLALSSSQHYRKQPPFNVVAFSKLISSPRLPFSSSVLSENRKPGWGTWYYQTMVQIRQRKDGKATAQVSCSHTGRKRLAETIKWYIIWGSTIVPNL